MISTTLLLLAAATFVCFGLFLGDHASRYLQNTGGMDFFKDSSSPTIRLFESVGAAIVSTRAIRNSTYQSSSAGEIKNFIDTDTLLMANPGSVEIVIEALCARIHDAQRCYPESKLCFIENDSGPIGLLCIAGSISARLNMPITTVRLRRTGNILAFKGQQIDEGDKVVIIEDVITTGRSVMAAIEKLETKNADVVAVVTLVDREHEKSEEFTSRNLDLFPVQTLSSIESFIPKGEAA